MFAKVAPRCELRFLGRVVTERGFFPILVVRLELLPASARIVEQRRSVLVSVAMPGPKLAVGFDEIGTWEKG